MTCTSEIENTNDLFTVGCGTSLTTTVLSVASFPDLHSQLLLLAVQKAFRTASDTSWACRAGNEATCPVLIIYYIFHFRIIYIITQYVYTRSKLMAILNLAIWRPRKSFPLYGMMYSEFFNLHEETL